MVSQPDFWDFERSFEALSAECDPLERLAVTIDFEMFQLELLQALRRGGLPLPRRPSEAMGTGGYRARADPAASSSSARGFASPIGKAATARLTAILPPRSTAGRRA